MLSWLVLALEMILFKLPYSVDPPEVSQGIGEYVLVLLLAPCSWEEPVKAQREEESGECWEHSLRVLKALATASSWDMRFLEGPLLSFFLGMAGLKEKPAAASLTFLAHSGNQGSSCSWHTGSRQEHSDPVGRAGAKLHSLRTHFRWEASCASPGLLSFLSGFLPLCLSLEWDWELRYVLTWSSVTCHLGWVRSQKGA